MSTNEPRPGSERDTADASNTITPLDGEAGIPSVVRPTGVNVSRKGIFAVALLALSLVAVSARRMATRCPSASATAQPRQVAMHGAWT